MPDSSEFAPESVTDSVPESVAEKPARKRAPAKKAAAETGVEAAPKKPRGRKPKAVEATLDLAHPAESAAATEPVPVVAPVTAEAEAAVEAVAPAASAVEETAPATVAQVEALPTESVAGAEPVDAPVESLPEPVPVAEHLEAAPVLDAGSVAHEAYLLWLAEGQPHGRDLDHWVQAEQIVRRRAQGTLLAA